MSAAPNIVRRPGERRNFICLLQDPATKETCREPGQFQTLLALAIHDYRVPTATLAEKLGVKEPMVQSWFREDSPVIPPDAAIEAVLELIIRIMEADLTAEAAQT